MVCSSSELTHFNTMTMIDSTGRKSVAVAPTNYKKEEVYGKQYMIANYMETS